MKPREIEQTSKKLKSHILCCYLLAIMGSGIYCVADPSMKLEATITAMIFWAVGGLWYILTKFRVWWNNG